MQLSPQFVPDGNADTWISGIALTHPKKLALITMDGHVTFDELEAETTRVAARLADRGVGRGDRIGVCLNSRCEVVSTLRSILRLGAVFVPLDPEHPIERIDYILKDVDARILITTESLMPRLRGIARIVLTVESASKQSLPVVGVKPSLDDPACVLYTSGSTGQPKGVVRLHRGITARLATGPYEADDIFCHYTALPYAFSQERMFLPLMCGLPLTILPSLCQKDPARFAQEVSKYNVTRINVVPAVLEQLVDPRRRLYKYLGSVRSVTVGGAALSSAIIARFRRVLPNVRLIHVYGSTETGTLTQGDMMSGDEPNVGSPAPNMEVFILDEQRKPVSPGKVGEIYGGGLNLAAGYWQRPGLTVERFIPNPFGTGAPVLYRTGDRGLFLPDGRLQLAGRADRQVKVRGYRIELIEVENALLKLRDVREAAVVPQALGHDSRLVAYVCPVSPNGVTVSQVRKHLLRYLPTHMLPSAFVFLNELPRTPVGKLDSQALPNPGVSRPDLENAYVAPRTPLEDEIASIWAEILKKDCVGRDDHFLDLGGDSILAVEVCAAMEERLGMSVDTVSIFERPTVAEIAEVSPGAPRKQAI